MHQPLPQNNKFIEEAFKDGRKLFRLFKSIEEYQQMMKIILDQALSFSDSQKDEDFNRQKAVQIVFRILEKMCFFFYWLFDNISILSKVKLFNKNYEKYNILGSVFWFSGLIFSIGNLLSVMLKDDQKIYRMRKIKSMQSMKRQNSWVNIEDAEQNNQQSLTSLRALKQYTKQKQKQKKEALVNCLKNMCDLLPAGKDSNIISFVFKREIPEEVAGLGGAISAVISTYQSFKI